MKDKLNEFDTFIFTLIRIEAGFDINEYQG